MWMRLDWLDMVHIHLCLASVLVDCVGCCELAFLSTMLTLIVGSLDSYHSYLAPWLGLIELNHCVVSDMFQYLFNVQPNHLVDTRKLMIATIVITNILSLSCLSSLPPITATMPSNMMMINIA